MGQNQLQYLLLNAHRDLVFYRAKTCLETLIKLLPGKENDGQGRHEEQKLKGLGVVDPFACQIFPQHLSRAREQMMRSEEKSFFKGNQLFYQFFKGNFERIALRTGFLAAFRAKIAFEVVIAVFANSHVSFVERYIFVQNYSDKHDLL